MMQQRIDERVFRVSGGGMHDEPGGFVDDEQRFVLEQNVERNFFRLRFGGFWFGKMNLNFFSGARRMGRFDNFAVDANVAGFNQSLERAARNGWKFCPQKSIEPLTRQRFFDDEIFDSGIHPQMAQIFADKILIFIFDPRLSAKSAEEKIH